MLFRSNRGAAAVVFALAALAGCSSVDSGPPAPSEANPLDAEEGTLVYDLNAYRTQNGLPNVKICASLNVAASLHADDMRDHTLLSDTGSDGSTARSRACSASYQSACSASTQLAELVASGDFEGDKVMALWKKDTTTDPILRNAVLIVVGVGRSLGGQVPYWSLELADHDEASCGM